MTTLNDFTVRQVLETIERTPDKDYYRQYGFRELCEAIEYGKFDFDTSRQEIDEETLLEIEKLIERIANQLYAPDATVNADSYYYGAFSLKDLFQKLHT